MELVLYPNQYNLIWRTSWLALLSSFYALYNNNYKITISSGCIFISSVNYWRKPDYSWRRYADMVNVNIIFLYNHYYSYNTIYAKYYYTIISIAIMFYFLGIYYYKNNKLWESTICHIMLHVCTNIVSNIIVRYELELE